MSKAAEISNAKRDVCDRALGQTRQDAPVSTFTYKHTGTESHEQQHRENIPPKDKVLHVNPHAPRLSP